MFVEWSSIKASSSLNKFISSTLRSIGRQVACEWKRSNAIQMIITSPSRNLPLPQPFLFLFSIVFFFLPPSLLPSLSPEQSNVTIVRRLKACHPYRKRETRQVAFRPFQTFSFLSLSDLFTPSQPQTDRSPSPFMGVSRAEPKRVDQKRPWILGEPVRIMPDTSRCRFTGY